MTSPALPRETVTVEVNDLDRSTRLMSGLVAVSRASGLVRMLVALAVLGTKSSLSNVYSSANTVPTILFEMLAAGALSATLVPEFRRRYAASDDDGLARLASAVLAWGGLLLTAIVGVVLLWRAPMAELLLGRIDDPAQRADAVALFELLLVVLLPQVVAYLVNAVAVAYLQARRRFGAAVISPLINNLVLIATYGVFWVMRDGRGPSLNLSGREVATLGCGTLLGVVAMCAVPWFDARSHGFGLARPLPVRSPEVRRVVSDGAWAALFLAGGQFIGAVALPFTNAAEGHTIIWIFAWQLFLLPHALLAVPVLTARFPAMAAAHDDGKVAEMAETLSGGVRSIAATGLLAGALLWAVSAPVARLFALGAAADSAEPLARALAALGPGIAAYGLVHLLARRSYAVGDTRTPGLVAVLIALVAAGIMITAVDRVSVVNRLAVLGAAVSGANIVGVIALARVARPRIRLDRPLARRFAGAIGAAAVARSVVVASHGFDTGRGADALGVVAGGVAGTATYLMIDRLAGGPSWRRTVESLGAAEQTGERAIEEVAT